jgi:ATP-dependent protease ClpP protease subunit
MGKRFWGSEKIVEEVPKGNEDNGAEIVNTIGNKIYFYSGVKTSSILDLNKGLAELSGKLLSEYGDDAPPIKLHINSLGGYLYDAFAGIDAINRCVIPVHTVIEGVAASAATLMSVHGAKRFITKNSYMLIHQLSSCFWGKFEDFKDEMENNELFMTRIREIYRSLSEVPEDKINEILKHDLWWDAKKCLEYKLVDEII